MRLVARIKALGLTGWNMVAAIVASVVGAAAVIVPLLGGGDEPTHSQVHASPKAAALEYVENFHAGNWVAVWEALHPAEQAVVSQDDFVECRESQGATALLISADVTGIHSTSLVSGTQTAGVRARGNDSVGLLGPGSVAANLNEDEAAVTAQESASAPEYSGINADAATIVTVNTVVRTESRREETRTHVPMVATDDGYRLVFSPGSQLQFENGECPPPNVL